MRPRLHHLLVVGGTLAGLVAGVLVLDTDPPVFGWIVGLGAGLIGGAFLAAIASGEQLVGRGNEAAGSGSRRRPNPALRHLEGHREDHAEATPPPSANGTREHASSERGQRRRDE